MDFTLELTGIEFVTDNLTALQNPSIMHTALLQVGEEILRLAEPKLPHVTGQLKTSGEVNSKINKDVEVGYNSEYAGYQHQGRRMDGTRIVRNRPAGGESFFLSSTLDQNQTQLQEFFADRIEDGVAKHLK